MNHRLELFQLLNAHLEGTSDFDSVRFNQLLREFPELIDDYVDFTTLHGQLFWEAGLTIPQQGDGQPTLMSVQAEPAPTTTRRARLITVATAAICLLAITILLVTEKDNSATPVIVKTLPSADVKVPEDELPIADIRIGSPPTPEIVATDNTPAVTIDPEDLTPTVTVPEDFSDQWLTTRIDSLLQQSWHENEVQPSQTAEDTDWVRRAYLTYLGRIPTVEETLQYLRQPESRRDGQLIAALTASEEAAQHQAAVWTNLLVGRTEKPNVNRRTLQQFLTDSFQANQSWMNTVQQLITAEGRNDQNGATNFLLAHLNNQATPATAVTARLFLGQQIACVQCHDHPFAEGMKQAEYWELNAFFKDTRQERIARKGPAIHRLVEVPRTERMTFFETRSGLTQAVLPEYDGHTIEKNDASHRRSELARMLQQDSSHKVAKAMVNRMWAHFFGYGFTPQIDDIGPHVAVSHPEVMQLLTEAFVESNYDLKRLMSWIGQTNAWRLSSEYTTANAVDRPEIGEVPLFSRVYLKRMTPEQVYDSIRIAIRSAADAPRDNVADSVQHRNDWIKQFARSYNTDENDEELNFGGSIGQAMVMMNGVDVDEAIKKATQQLLAATSARSSVSRTLDRLSLAMLNRKPTSEESQVFRNRYRQLFRNAGPDALPAATEDMMWAYLNSSEFVIVR